MGLFVLFFNPEIKKISRNSHPSSNMVFCSHVLYAAAADSGVAAASRARRV